MIESFLRHPIAATLTLILMVLAGLWVTPLINTSLDPAIDLPLATVEVTWNGASAEDLEQLVVVPMETALRTLPKMRNLNSRAIPGFARLFLEFDPDADMTLAMDELKQRLGSVRNLPSDIEPPRIQRLADDELIASVLISGHGSLQELVPLVREMERDLLRRGIDQIRYDGLPEQELAILVSGRRLHELNTTLDELAAEIARLSSNVPAGTVGSAQGERQLRSLDQKRDVSGFSALELRLGEQIVPLGSIANIQQRTKEHQVSVTRNGKPTIEMYLLRDVGADAITGARILQQWLEETRPTLPAGVELTVHKEAWRLLGGQLKTVSYNGLMSLALVVIVLGLFLTRQAALWVTAGVPVAVLFGIALFYFVFDGGINILSLIAIIMVFGIVVDDAIVVAEETTTLHSRGMSPEEAARVGARSMFLPVMASSLTTLAAFVPLLLVGGVVGAVVLTIPQVLLCVIVASLIECFLILPTHMRASLTKAAKTAPATWRSRFESWFARFRDQQYFTWLRRTLAYPGATLACAIAALFIAISLVASQRVGLNLVTGLDLESVVANVEFAASVTPHQRQQFMTELEAKLLDVNQQQGGGEVTGHLVKHNLATLDNERQEGSEFASIEASYAFHENRSIAPAEFVQRWKDAVVQPAFVERLSIDIDGGYNNGAPAISFVLRGRDVETLKAASVELQSKLSRIAGVHNVFDNLPYGKEQVIFALSPSGKALGLTGEQIGAQLRSAFSGRRVQIFNEDESELEVRVQLPSAERVNLAALKQFPIMAPNGELVPLDAVASLNMRRGIDVIRHDQGEMAVRISADVDEEIGNAIAITNDLKDDVLPAIAKAYGLSIGLAGSSEEDAKLLAVMQLGFLLTILLIYIILAWTFGSFLWPLAVMTTIPFGIAGAIFGHWLMGYDLGAMSLVAIFALTGIVVNDSIVLINAFQTNLRANLSVRDAVQAAAISRFRAVLLTTLTTVAGLSTLLFDNSTLSIYLVPIAITICFGLAFGTLLVLLVVPAMVLLIDAANMRLKTQLERLRRPTSPSEVSA